jgi:hypothetical protein
LVDCSRLATQVQTYVCRTCLLGLEHILLAMRELVPHKPTYGWGCSDCSWKFVLPKNWNDHPEMALDDRQILYEEEVDKQFEAHNCRFFPGRPIAK